MANARIDENRENTSLAYDSNGSVRRLLVDSTTGRLLVLASIGNGGSVNVNKIDENRENVAIGVDSNENPIPFHINATNNYLLIDLLCE